jgi:uncharacterized membrane protein
MLVSSQKPGSPVPAGARYLARALLGVALGLDLYLAMVAWRSGAIAGCGPESGCHTVLSSRWAHWLGLPVSWPAALIYAITLVATLRLRPHSSVAQQQKAWVILIPSTILIMAAALWFASLQVFVLRTICPFCMATHACALVGAGLLLLQAPVRWQHPQERNASAAVVIRPRLALNLGAGALLALGLFITGQILRPGQRYASTPLPAVITTTKLAQPPAREFQVLEGRFRFALDEVPLFGRPDAPHTIVSLVDYTCHHCREVHAPLMQVWRQFSNQVAVVSLPMPLDSKCNRAVSRTLPAHTNACALARVGLTVWLANRQLGPTFDEWIFTPALPPSPEAAEAYGRQLVGEMAFRTAATNSWIDRQIRQNVSLYEEFYRRFHKSYMPEVLIGTNLISGPFSREQLTQLLSEQWGLRESAK